MKWFDPILPVRRMARTVYLSNQEVDNLMGEAECIKKLLSNGKKISLSDIIRIKLFYTEEYIRERLREERK